MNRRKLMPIAGVLAIGVISRLRGKPAGRYHGIPYDWRRPTVARAKARWWNPAEPRLFVPRVFGVGWDMNLARLLGRHPNGV
jgi:hypothetical protein